MRGGRRPTLEDIVESFNDIMQPRPEPQEKRALVAFMRQLRSVEGELAI